MSKFCFYQSAYFVIWGKKYKTVSPKLQHISDLKYPSLIQPLGYPSSLNLLPQQTYLTCVSLSLLHLLFLFFFFFWLLNITYSRGLIFWGGGGVRVDCCLFVCTLVVSSSLWTVPFTYVAVKTWLPVSQFEISLCAPYQTHWGRCLFHMKARILLFLRPSKTAKTCLVRDCLPQSPLPNVALIHCFASFTSIL